MNLNDRFVGGILLGFGAGSIAGCLLGLHINRTRHERDLAEVREHFHSRAEEFERAYRANVHVDILPTLARNFGQDTGYIKTSPRSSDFQVGPDGERLPDDNALEEDDQPDPLDLGLEGRGAASDSDDPLFGLDDDDYEPGAPTSLGVDGSGNEIEDDDRGEEDGSENERNDSDGSPTAGRGPGPYLLTDVEFFGECETYQKLTIMYYRGDDVLVDDKASIIPDIRGTVGLGTLSQFGKNEGDPNILYVRNDRLEIDFEICLDYGSYIEGVLHYGTANPKPPRHVLSG